MAVLAWPQAIFRSICVQVKWLPGVDGTQIWCIDHCLFQLVEGSLVYSCSIPLEACFKHRSQRGRYSPKSFNKLLVKSAQTDRLSNLMNRGRRRPTSNALDLLGTHVYSIFIGDVSANRYSSLGER